MSQSLNLGGSERQVAEVAMSLDRTLFRPSIVCFDARGVRADDLRRAGVPVVELPVRSFVAPKTVSLAWQFVTSLRADGVVLAHPFDVPTVLFGVPLARAAGVPIVLSSQRGDRRLFSRKDQRLLKVTDYLADGVVVNSDYVRHVLTTTFGVADGRLHTCRNGLDTRAFDASNRARLPTLAPGGLIVGIVAALRSEKSIETLIDAFSRLADSRHHLVIVGDGPCAQELRARAESAGVMSRTTFAPATPDVASWYRSIDLFVLPSINESFSNSLMEAMACGCAVVASNVGGNPELVQDGSNGLLFEPRNAVDLAARLESLIDDEILRTRLAAAAVDTIEAGYTRAIAAKRLASLYEEMIRRSA
jgi:glycosyltransferase involved in cell wall biosynthesis